MSLRIAIATAAVAAAFAAVPASASAVVTCPLGTKPVGTGWYNPTNGNEIFICFLSPGP